MEECSRQQLFEGLLTWVGRFVSMFETMTRQQVKRISKLLIKIAAERQWLLKEVCQIFPATCAWSMHLKTKYNYSEQEIRAHQRICDSPSHWGLGDLNLIPARTKAWTFTLKVSCSVFWTCGNMLFRHNGPQSWGIRTTPAHARPVWRGSLWQGSKGHWASPQMVKFPSWKRLEYFLVRHSWLNNEKMEAWRG